ncbi:MAG: PIG-L family deacetylase [Opitutae bacterium]|jgi:N-acetylglucosamine malate deacetylase 1|nr:PIG-L family deacetylase [Opitutae bacterium]MBT5691390.1 PIG-L family deacetylase [Opitutae bacterium]
MNTYHELVEKFASTLKNGRQIPLGGVAPLSHPVLPDNAPNVLIFSPHPDDEVIIGGLPIRMMRECGMRVINIAVTQGSKRDRQEERLMELENCCQHIGFDLITTREGTGLERINRKTRDEDPSHWEECVECIAGILGSTKPHSIFFPHDNDWNSTHIGTHLLVTDALAKLPGDFTCHTFETEFWGAMDNPNLMIESSHDDLADMLTALSFHVGEVQRNPYHLLTPAWMQDNVRRGAELVGGQGGDAPDFTFATLYRQQKWIGKNLKNEPQSRALSASENPEKLF